MNENNQPDIICRLVPLEEYENLIERSDWLACLEAAGVDNWSGYDYAHEIQRERRKENVEQS